MNSSIYELKKIVTVSQSTQDTPNCRNGGIANCPNRDFLDEIGDVFIDGGDVVDAAREGKIKQYWCSGDGHSETIGVI